MSRTRFPGRPIIFLCKGEDQEPVDFEKLSASIPRIVEIVSSVPEPFKERAFDALLEGAITDAKPKVHAPPTKREEQPPKGERKGSGEVAIEGFPTLQRHFVAWMKKFDVSADELETVIEFDGDTIHYARPPDTKVKAQAQIAWSLLLALEQGIKSDVLEVTYETVQAKTKDEDCYDSSNFANNFNNNKGVFRAGVPKKGEGAKRLSGDGEKQLAELVKSLAK